MKKQILYLSTFVLLVTISSCKKGPDEPTTNGNEMAAHTEDQSRFSAEMDAVANDANLAIESSTSFTGRLQDIQGLICDATIDVNSATNPMTVTITYSGTNCLNGRIRTGVVVLSMEQGTQWKNAGAVISASFQNLKITRIADGKSITINGTQLYTNESGGLLVNLATAGTITHTIVSPGLSIKFDNGSQRDWQVAKRRVFTYNHGAVITTTGMHVDSSSLHIAEWGTNRFGGEFTTSTTAPIVVRQDCNFRITSGAILHTTSAATATVTFGLDVTGAPTSCPGVGGHYYYKLIWSGANGASFGLILPY
ncbi:MAG: hypothetical protein H7Y42_03205 [Chitinophagaceae bacterium]|nr:hypothetical protein [Chitinophagaceae bacterium]